MILSIRTNEVLRRKFKKLTLDSNYPNRINSGSLKFKVLFNLRRQQVQAMWLYHHPYKQHYYSLNN